MQPKEWSINCINAAYCSQFYWKCHKNITEKKYADQVQPFIIGQSSIRNKDLRNRNSR